MFGHRRPEHFLLGRRSLFYCEGGRYLDDDDTAKKPEEKEAPGESQVVAATTSSTPAARHFVFCCRLLPWTSNQGTGQDTAQGGAVSIQ